MSMMGEDLEGDVLGELLGIDTMGDELDGMGNTVGMSRSQRRRLLARRRAYARHHHMMALPPKPGWRGGIITPGVNAPREGLEPLPLVADNGTGTFAAATSTLTFRARPQRPFRAERLLAQVFRSGASAAAAACITTGIFIGTTLQQLQIGSFNVEFFAPTAFGVRLDLSPAEPGIDIAIQTALTSALAGSDTLNVQLLFLGRSIGG